MSLLPSCAVVLVKAVEASAVVAFAFVSMAVTPRNVGCRSRCGASDIVVVVNLVVVVVGVVVTVNASTPN